MRTGTRMPTQLRRMFVPAFAGLLLVVSSAAQTTITAPSNKFTTAITIASTSTGVPADEAVHQAHADINGDGVSGRLELAESKLGNGTEVTLNLGVKGLMPGLHGVHFHAIGRCSPDFDAAGGHFDPGPAGNTDPDANHPFHMGDLPNLSVGANGEGAMKTRTNRVTLSAGPLSLFDADGSAVIIHRNPDQGTTGAPKSGVSGGARVGCGVLIKD